MTTNQVSPPKNAELSIRLLISQQVPQEHTKAEGQLGNSLAELISLESLGSHGSLKAHSLHGGDE